jgi:signal transduction histidine kinase
MRLRLILSFALIVIISISLVVLVARQGAENEVRAFMFRGELSDSNELVESLETHYRTDGNWDAVEELMLPGRHGQGKGQGKSEGTTGQQFILADSSGNVILDTGNPEAAGRLSINERQSAIPLQVNGKAVGYLVVEGGTGFNNEQGQQLISRLNNAALVAALVAGALSLIVALFLAYRIMRPINELTQAANQLGEGDLTQRVRVSGNDEFAMLGRTFNQMAESLQHSEESRRALTADIAHELRNPLAVQRANLEALQDGIYPLTADNLGPIIEQNVLLNRLVDDLRTLALADAGQLELNKTRLNLKNLTERVTKRYKPGAMEKGVSLIHKNEGGTTPDQYTIMGDPMRLEQILGNLISNALRYTPEGGQITLQLAGTQSRVKLTVHDGGAGIPQESLPYIFDRFYRADRSRSRTDGGSGLGLAIARQIAEAHGGTLTAANHPEGGAVLTLSLPKAGRADG